MTEEQHRAILSLCETNVPQASQDEARYLRILDSADPREVLPEFASQLWTSHTDERIRTISGYLIRVAEKLPIASWPAIDQKLRFRIWRSHSSADALNPGNSPLDPRLVLVSLCHRDGWTRQAALKFIDLLPPYLAACLLLVRANDWIKSIRMAAAVRIPQILGNLNPSEQLRLVPLVNHLRNCGRLEQPTLPETWLGMLNHTLDEQAWLDAWTNAPAKDQRLYLSLLDSYRQLPGPAIRNALLRSKNRMALIFYLKRIFPHLPEEEQKTAAYYAERSRVVPVRRAWLDHVIDQHPEATQPLLIKELVSVSKSLRDLARFHLSRLFPMDFREHYQQMLDSGIHEDGALFGLVEVSPETAHEEALKRLESPIPKVQKAAILSLSATWVEANLPWFLSQKGCSSPAVWFATRKRLSTIPRALGDFILWESDQLDLPLAISLFLVQQAPYFKKWDGLEYLLIMVDHPLLNDDAKSILRIWRRGESKTYSRLPDARKRRLIHLLEITSLPDQTKEDLRFLLERAE